MIWRVKGFAVELGCKVLENDSGPYGDKGWKFPTMVWSDGPKDRIADIYLEYKGRRIIVEVNGEKSGQGHYSKDATNKDRLKERRWQEHFGIPTITVWTSWSDFSKEDLQKEIDHALMLVVK